MVWFFIYVLFLHWVGDFVLQSRWMADNKSKDWEALVLHVFVYAVTLWFGVFVMQAWAIEVVCRYALVNFIIHIGVDSLTSRMTKVAIAEKNMHLFFGIVGADQFVHAVTILITTEYMLGLPVWGGKML